MSFSFLFFKIVLFGKSASYKRAAAKYRDLCNDDLVFLSERTGGSRGSKAEGQIRAVPETATKGKGEIPARDSSNLASACLAGGHALPFL